MPCVLKSVFLRTLSGTSLFAIVVLVLCGRVSAQTGMASGTVAFRNATLETMGPDGRMENATLVIRDGKIIAAGVNADVPDDARLVDATGKTIMPGIVDPYFVFNNQGGNGGGRRGSLRRLSEYFYPYEVNWVPFSRSGITTANLVQSGTGQSAVAQIVPSDLENLLLKPDGFLFATVTNQTASLNFVRNGLKPPTASGRRRSRGRDRSEESPFDMTSAPVQDQSDQQEQEGENTTDTAELWNQVRAGDQPLFVNVNNTATVLHLLKALGDHEAVKVAMVCSGSNLYEVMGELSSRKITLILQPGIDNVPYTSERVNIARMALDNNVPFVFSFSLNRGQLNAHQDDPMFVISMLVKSGLPREAALQAVTIGPAKLIGMEETLGSLEENKQANLLIFDGDPLETGSRLEQVMVEGRTVHEN
ncbi:MAG: amidohydrolase family protein [Pirellulales bacterium]|nr:amidohydrolase family protein [Pirellulales bacterium]